MMEKKERYIEYDIVRILACFGVIMIHSAVYEQNLLYEYDTLKFQAVNIWGVLSRWTVPIFVMISGMMILQRIEKESLRKLFFNRVCRMVIVYLVWSGVYSFYNVFVLGNVYAGSKLKTFIDGCFSGEIHMWYLLVCTGLYIIAPILIVLINNLNARMTRYWLFGMFIFSSVLPFVIKLNIKFVSVIVNNFFEYSELYFLNGWTLYFVLGYYVQKHSFSKKEKWMVYLMGILSVIFTLYATVGVSWKTGKALGVLPYEYPNIYFMSISVLVFVKEEIAKIRISEKFQKIIQQVSQLTFGIYLSHVVILKILYMFGINIQMCHTLISVPLVSAIVFMLGGVITYVIRRIPYVGRYIA